MRIGKMTIGTVIKGVLSAIVETFKNYTEQVDLMTVAGIDSIPAVNDIAVIESIERSSGKAVCLGVLNQSKLLIPGEIKIYSRLATAEQASIKLDSLGLIEMKNQITDLKTLVLSLITTIEGLVTINAVPGSPVTLSPATIALLEAEKIKWSLLLK